MYKHNKYIGPWVLSYAYAYNNKHKQSTSKCIISQKFKCFFEGTCEGGKLHCYLFFDLLYLFTVNIYIYALWMDITFNFTTYYMPIRIYFQTPCIIVCAGLRAHYKFYFDFFLLSKIISTQNKIVIHPRYRKKSKYVPSKELYYGHLNLHCVFMCYLYYRNKSSCMMQIRIS